MKLLPGVLGLCGLWFIGTHSEPIPEPSGKYNVGVRRVVVDFVSENDPVSPNNISTEFIATLYYPTDDSPAPAAPYIEPELVKMYEDYYRFNISHLTSTNRWNASFLCNTGPSLIFGPGGWGPSTDGFVILLSELASHGYVVAALDHPYEQPFVRFPNGTGVVGLPLSFSSSQPFIDNFHAVRVREMLYFIDYWPKLVSELGAPFETSEVSLFGHSLGGSAALNAAAQSDKVAVVFNQDGSIFGTAASNTPAANVKMPSLLLGFENHSSLSDRSWNNYTLQQTEWWRSISVKGVQHPGWTDQSFWKLWQTNRTNLGPIDGRRMMGIRSAYVRAFFDEHLRGKESALLDGPSTEWPEVTVHAGNDL